MTDTTKVPYLKSTALIDLKVGTAFVSNIQASLVHLTQGLSKEQIDTLKGCIESRQPLEGNDLVIHTLTSLVMNIMQIAKDTDQIEYKDLESTLGL